MTKSPHVCMTAILGPQSPMVTEEINCSSMAVDSPYCSKLRPDAQVPQYSRMELSGSPHIHCVATAFTGTEQNCVLGYLLCCDRLYCNMTVVCTNNMLVLLHDQNLIGIVYRLSPIWFLHIVFVIICIR